MDDFDDILGGNTLPIVRGTGATQFTAATIGWSAVTLTALVALVFLWRWLLGVKERRYRLSMRRSHGIPDEDSRPFNVAYAAALRTRQQAEAKARPKPEPPQAPSRNQQADAISEYLRQRHGPQRVDIDTARFTSAVAHRLPGAFESSIPGSIADIYNVPNSNHGVSPAPEPVNYTDYYNDNGRPFVSSEPSDIPVPTPQPPLETITRSGRRHVLQFKSQQKRGRVWDEADLEEDAVNAKKSRVEREDLDDDDEERMDVDHRPTRGAKRFLDEDDEDDEDVDTRRARDKRARKASSEKHASMEVDERDDDDEGQVVLRKSHRRGKKRDRAEAGSTFGGDDDDIADAEDDDGESSKRRRRKRRTVSHGDGKRKSNVRPSRAISTRGKKRDRDVEEVSGGDGDESPMTGRVSKKKRGKKEKVPSTTEDEDDTGDVSMADVKETSDSMTKGRKIGDEWESNGVMYKLGANGERLRQALVKRARNKFTMPKDSQHPDSQTNMEVYVETWLTEEEYKEAKNQQLLAWQDAPKVPMAVDPPETPGDVFDFESPNKNGKNLLWKGLMSTPTTPYFQNSPAPSPMVSLQVQRDPFHQSIASDVGLRFNPFEQHRQGQPIRRLGTTRLVFGALAPAPEVPTTPTAVVTIPATTPGAAGLDESVSSPFDTPVKAKAGVTRSFSKWEKQDLEAEAMKKIREANKRKEGEIKSVEKKKVTFDLGTPSTSTPPVLATSASTTTSSIPNFFAKPTDKPAHSTSASTTENKPPTSLFGNPPAAASTSKDTATPIIPAIPAPAPSATPSAPADSALKQTQSSQLGKGMPSTFNMPQASGSNMAPPPLPTKLQSPFPFNAPASASKVSSAPPNFFAAPPQTQKQQTSTVFGGGDQKKPEQTSTQNSGASLLARMGGFASGPQSEDPKPQQQATSAPGPSSFFQNPGPSQASTSKAQPVFGANSSAFRVPNSGNNQSAQPQQASSIAVSTNPATNTTSAAPLKFDFGFAAKATPAATSTGANSSLSGALGEQPKTTPVTTFGFASKPAESSTSTTNPPESNSGPAKFTFGQTSAFSSNTASGSTSKSAVQPNTSSAPPKSAFGVSAFGAPSALGSTSVFGSGNKTFGTAGGTSAFGGPSAFASPAAANVFGGSGATSAFGGAGSGGGAGTGASGSNTPVFGITSAAPKTAPSIEAPKSVLGNPPTTATAAPSTGDEKPKFSFAAPSAPSSATPASTNAPNFSFKFGPTPSGSGAAPAGQSAFGAAPAVGQSAFGAAPAAGQSVFGAAPATGQSVFGAAPAAGQSAFGAQPAVQSAFGAKPASSAFGFTSSATPAVFGFTAPAANTNNNAFSSTAEQKQQQSQQ